MAATSYLLGVSTRRVEKLAESMGITSLSKSQVSAMAAELDGMVEQFRSRPLDGGPYTFVWIDALTQKVPMVAWDLQGWRYSRTDQRVPRNPRHIRASIDTGGGARENRG